MTPRRADYAPTRQPGHARGGVIAGVEERSPAQRAGLASGQTVLAVDGHAISDVLDWQWYSEGTAVDLDVVDADGLSSKLHLARSAEEPWGLSFEAALFDGVHTCRNGCAFCFMGQLPRGLRSSLYLRDDDYRLSFMQGNFITLTNLSDDDVARIITQHLSPLHVSLHAVDPAVRARLVCASEDRALERFDALREGGIDLHVQIVLVPGENDGPVLDETLTWLAERDGVASVGIVGLGYTRHQTRFAAGFEAAAASRAVVEQVEAWREAMRARDGVSWVHLADEFYLNAGLELPPAAHYDGFPQYENGIGLARDFVDAMAASASELREACAALEGSGRQLTVVTGTMAAELVRGALRAHGAGRCSGSVRVLPVTNTFFGGNVGVTGLLTGEDLIRCLSEDEAGRGGRYFLPDVVTNSDGLTLDGFDLATIERESGAKVCLVSSDAAGVLEALRQCCDEPGPHATR